MKMNPCYRSLKPSYLFSDIAHRVEQYRAQHPDADIIRMGIGDVTRPLCPAVTEAMHQAVEEQASAQTFHGYGPEQGYDFLKKAVAGYYARRNIQLSDDEIFISDGAKSDLGNILDLFDRDNAVLIPDPVYPVYVDTNLMAGRAIRFLNANAGNGFLPLPDSSMQADIIYLCSPNNPTGAVYDHQGLRQWVDFAREREAVILFDAAYEAFVTGDLPRSIYEIEGAKECAIEFCSLSKTAGFTGTRCGYTLVPEALVRQGDSLRAMWLRRQTTKFNGVPYVVQWGAAAVFTEQGQRQIQEALQVYRRNATVMTETMDTLGMEYTGGKNSPYLWLRCPGGMSSWEFFDYLLDQARVVGTPGAGFGANGEGYFRLTAFGQEDATREAMERLVHCCRSL